MVTVEITVNDKADLIDLHNYLYILSVAKRRSNPRGSEILHKAAMDIESQADGIAEEEG